MNQTAKLTPRETQVAELLAWGAAKKEVADKLFISTRTVENTARHIYEKVGVSKSNELSAWWFCTKFKISFDLSPLKKCIVAYLMLILVIPQIITNDDNVMRVFRSKTATRTCRLSRRKSESDNSTIDF